MPPSAEIVSPVTKRAASDARNTTTRRDVVRVRPAAERGLRLDLLDHAGDRLVAGPERGVDDTGRDRVHADPGRAQLHRERAGGGVDRALRRRVGRAPRRAHEPRDRREVDDRTAARGDHRRQQRRDQEQGSAHVHREHRVDRRGVEVDGGQPRRGGRVVHEDRRPIRARRAPRARDASALPRRRARRAARPGRGADRRRRCRAVRGSRPESATRAPAAVQRGRDSQHRCRVTAPVTSAVRPSSENSSMSRRLSEEPRATRAVSRH